MNTSLAHRSATPSKLNSQLDFILLDGSGSMDELSKEGSSTKWMDSTKAIEAYVETLRQTSVASHITLTVFDSTDLEYVARDCPIGECVSLITSPIGHHGGSTPLYDAIQMMGRKLRDLDPPRCHIILASDGEESGSRFTTHEQAKAILDWCRAKGWQITFIGVGFNNSRAAKLLGVRPAESIGVEPRLLEDAARALGAKRSAYGLYGTDMHFSDDERVKFGGFLSGPSK